MPLQSGAFDAAVASSGNPLSGMTSIQDAYNNALTMRKGALDIQKTYGEQAVGNALQQATDEQGNLDIPKAQALAAKAGPNAAFAMQGFLKTGSELRGQQILQGGAMYNNITRGALTIAGDPSDENVTSSFGSLIAAMPGQRAQLEAERDRVLAMKDPAQRVQYATQHGIAALDGLQGLHHAIGASPVTLETGGTIQGGSINPWTGAITPAGAGVNKTLSPENAMQGGIQYPATADDVKAGRAASVGAPVFVSGPDVITRFGLGGILPPGARAVGGGGGGGGPGVVNSDGTRASPDNPPRVRQLNVPNQPPAPGGYQGTGTGTGADKVPIYQPPAGTPPAAPASSQPPGPRSSLEGGVPVASANALQAPTVGAPGPPSPLVSGDVSAIMAGMNRARATPATGTQTAYNTFSVGPGTEEAQGYKTSADKLSADDLAATEWQSTKLPYIEALKNYGEGTKTGPTTDFWNQVAGTIRTPLAKIGINVGPLADTTERVDALGKWLASIQSTNPVSAKSDAELAQVLKGSASTHINEVAGEDMVKAGFTLRRMGAALNQDWHNNPALQTQYGTYLRYLGDMNNKIDPRAFSIDMLNPAQKQRLVAAIKNGSDADAERFESSLALARRSRQVP